MQKGACISECGLYRYWLSRMWGDGLPYITWIMLNPSKADATKDDPTIRKIVAFSKKWGYGGIYVANLFAFRATDPKKMKLADDPIGSENNRHIVDVSSNRMVVAAWGTNGTYKGRDREVIDIIYIHCYKLKCLGITKAGHPKHPLYVPNNTELIPFRNK